MSRDTTKLHPELQVILKKFLAECAKQGLKVTVTDTIRTVAEQNAILAKGNSKASGNGYQSPHQWGVAFDICQASSDKKKWYNEAFLRKCAAIGKKMGLFWGGDFKSYFDGPHFEMIKFMPNCSTATLKKEYGTPEKFIATWGKASTATAPKTTTTSKAVKVGSVVTINKGAVYGGLSTARGKAVPSPHTGGKKHTVKSITTHKGVKEALLGEINSWVAVKSLTLL